VVGKTADGTEFWFVTGSQHLYGPGTLRQVDEDSRMIVEYLNRHGGLPYPVVWKPVVKTQDEITALFPEAECAPDCAGVICWMHTFSPAKMWINGLKALRKPMLHLNTQVNSDLPWKTIDMDFMNLNQSAHGDREFGYICSRLGIRRKIVCGHYRSPRVLQALRVWLRVAAAWHGLQRLRVARIGDNMRDVAVTEGNKVDAQIQFGFSVSGYGVGDVVAHIREVAGREVDELVDRYRASYQLPDVSDRTMDSIRSAARQELGLRAFLQERDCGAFTTNFEDLNGLEQLPGLASQRLMADGFGFGAEGDWKTAALLWAIKKMANGLPGGVSFMEDYTYHLEPGRERILGAHMLEVCPTLAASCPRLEVHPLGIGGKADPARLIFSASPGPAINATLVEFGSKFRLVVNEIEIVPPDAPLASLPTASAVWIPRPDMAASAERWIAAGGAHHSVCSAAVGTEYMEDFSRIAGIELVLIR